MVDIVDEVHEDMRRERAARFWQQVGGYVVTASILIILATVSVVAWQDHVETKQAEATEVFLAADKALKARNYDEAVRKFGELAQSDAKGLPSLAAMKLAYSHTQAGRDAEALESYKALIDNHAADAAMRDMARIYAAQIMTGQSNATLEGITAMLQPVTGDDDNPFRAIAREQLAHASLQFGDKATAYRLLAELSSDMRAPVSLRRRAQAQASSLAEVSQEGATAKSVTEDATPQDAAE